MRNASAFISSTSKRASFRATNAPPTPTSHHLAISTTQNITTYVPFQPPANMANPWFGSDVAASARSLATLRAAVVQRPLVPSKISTALIPPAHAQRISIHFQHLNARLLRATHAPPTPTSHHLAISTTLKTKCNPYPSSSRLRIWPILDSAVTSLQDSVLPR